MTLYKVFFGNKKNVFLTLLMSYILVLLLPVTVGFFLYNKTDKILIENVNRSNTAMLEQITQVVDTQVTEVSKLTSQISQNQKLPALLNMKKIEQSDDLYKFVEFVRILSNYQMNNNFISDFYVYLPNTDTVLSPSMKTDSKTFYNNIYSYENMTYEEYMEKILSSYHLNSFLPSKSVGQGKHMITFIQSLPVGEKKEIKGTLVILIDEQEIRNMINRIERLNNGVVNLYSEQMEILMTNSGNSKLTLKNPESSYTYHEDDMILTYSPKIRYGWSFLIAVPKEIVLSQVNVLKTWAVFLVMVCLLVGITVSYYFAHKNYRPIRDVVQEIIKRKSMTHVAVENDYDFIKETILTSINNESYLNSQLSKQVPVIQSDFLSKLFRGHIDELDMTETNFSLVGVRFIGDYFRIIIINIDEFSYLFTKDKEQDFALIRFVICNISNEVLKDNGYSIVMEPNRLVILITQSDPHINQKNQLENLVNSIVDIIERRLKTRITMAISQIHEGVKNINRCYNEALEGIGYKMIFGQSSIIYYEDISKADPFFYHYPMETEVQIINFTKNGDYSNVHKLMDQVYDLHFHTNHITPEMCKCLFVDIMGTFFKLSGMLNIDSKQLVEENDLIQYVLISSTADEMLKKIKELFRLMCLEVNRTKTDRNEQLFQKITDYVHEHYRNNMISIKMIADYFELHPNYLSSFFKKYSGQNISDYIVNLRIIHSKELLANSILTIMDIAHCVGYTNDVGFIRVFKKMEGVTPGKYRESLKT
jgi:two-component system response regulator YesN